MRLDRPTDHTPAPVPDSATQAGERRARWAWVEPCVWTDRMLTALEQGVHGGCWFSLIDKVYALPTLRAAWTRVQANAGAAGVDHQTIPMVAARLEETLASLARDLRANLIAAGVRRAELFAEDRTRSRIRFHDLRATGITWMAIRGDDPLKIKQRAGHRSLSTTERYIRVAEELRAGFGDVFPRLPAALVRAS